MVASWAGIVFKLIFENALSIPCPQKSCLALNCLTIFAYYNHLESMVVVFLYDLLKKTQKTKNHGL